MEGRAERYRQLSPERTKIWTHKPSKQSSNRKVAVVYYLCRNRHLQHPHFMEVPLSSSNGLYLKDVVERLGVLRGSRVASMYSWSCKRRYKNGYVWQDLCEDDLIPPARGDEYVLKGSELFEESDSGPVILMGAGMLQNQKALPEPPSARSKDGDDSPSSPRATKSSEGGEASPSVYRPCSSTMSPDSTIGKNSGNDSLNLTEHKPCKTSPLTDSSTQIEEKAVKTVESQEICERGVSTDDDSCALELENRGSLPPEASKPPETLDSLIQADIRKFNNLQMSSCTKLKASTMLMQLITCGSISVKDRSFGLIQTYKPASSTSFTKGETDRMGEPLPGKEPSKKTDSSRNVGGKVIRLEERFFQELGL